MHNIIRLKETDSTNRDAFTRARAGAEHGVSVIAEVQRKGRGRLGRSWISPAGKGLYCSIILRPRLRFESYPQLTFAAGIAVVNAIEEHYSLTPGLKWPNDVYFGSKKCGGILTESSAVQEGEQGAFAVIGIGLNVNSRQDDFPELFRHRATSLLVESGIIGSPFDLFLSLHSHLLRLVDDFERDGFAPLLTQWKARDILLGKTMNWVAVSGKKVTGISLGPDALGRLHVRDMLGNVHEVLSGDIELA